MPLCCVPFCSSKSGKTANVSFHEFPVNIALREAWLKNISRENFQVNDKSPSSVVCSLHLTDNDYVPALKYRRLKQGTVPTIFPCYPQYKVPKSVPKRGIKRAAEDKSPAPAKSSKNNLDNAEESSVKNELAELLLYMANKSPEVPNAAEVSEVSGEPIDSISPVCHATVQTHENIINDLELARKKIRLLQARICKQQKLIQKQQAELNSAKKK